MNLLYQVSKALSIALFLYYGIAVLVSNAMAAEFERFGMSRFRRLTGGLEVLGAGLSFLSAPVFKVEVGDFRTALRSSSVKALTVRRQII